MGMNEIFGAKESYQLPDLIMDALLSHDIEKIEQAKKQFSGMNMSDYFQNDAGDRDKLKQDFTPACVSSLVSRLMIPGNFIDECAGTGSLTQAAVESGHGSFTGEEISERTIPFNLLNDVIHGYDGVLYEADVLRSKRKTEYHIQKDGTVTKVEPHQISVKYKNVIMNPPYSLNFKDNEEYKTDPDFQGMIIPSSKADYGFVLRGLAKLEDDGRLLAILPHGVLFRGQKEEIIRKWLIDNKMISAVIGLPNNLFMNTGIPVCIMVIQKNSENILVIDASKEFEKGKKQNSLTSEQIQKIVDTFNGRKNVDKYSSVVSYSEIHDNEYNLNIPRYVDSFEQEPLPDMHEILDNLKQIEAEERKTMDELYKMLSGLECSDEDDKKIVHEHMELLKRKPRRKEKPNDVQLSLF